MYRILDARTPSKAAEAAAWLMCGGCLVDGVVPCTLCVQCHEVASWLQMPRTHSMNPKPVCDCFPVEDMLLLPSAPQALENCASLQDPCSRVALCHDLSSRRMLVPVKCQRAYVPRCLAVSADWPAWKRLVQCYKHHRRLQCRLWDITHSLTVVLHAAVRWSCATSMPAEHWSTILHGTILISKNMGMTASAS